MADVTRSAEERLAVLETKSTAQDARIAGQDEWLKSIDGKVSELLKAAHMAGGAWQATLRIGGLMVVIVGFFYGAIELVTKIFRG